MVFVDCHKNQLEKLCKKPLCGCHLIRLALLDSFPRGEAIYADCAGV